MLFTRGNSQKTFRQKNLLMNCQRRRENESKKGEREIAVIPVVFLFNFISFLCFHPLQTSVESHDIDCEMPLIPSEDASVGCETFLACRTWDFGGIET